MLICILVWVLAGQGGQSPPPAVSNSDVGYRFGTIDAKVDGVTRKLDAIDNKIDVLIDRVGKLEARVERLDERVSLLQLLIFGLGSIIGGSLIKDWMERSLARKVAAETTPPRTPLRPANYEPHSGIESQGEVPPSQGPLRRL